MPTEVFATPGTTIWTAPAGVTSVDAACWGGGGGGGRRGNAGSGGGGGGAYSAATVTVVPGNAYDVTVGAAGVGGSGGDADGTAGGDTSFVNVSMVLAKGGSGGLGASGTAGSAGGAAASGVGTTKYSGGTGNNGGQTGTVNNGGGGGSSAGTGEDGHPGQPSNGQAGGQGGEAPAGGGDGGDGGISADGGDGTAPGGGGGGGGRLFDGGDGGAGKVTLTYVLALSTVSHSASDITRALLVAAGVGTDSGTWPIGHAKEPSDPDNAITVRLTTGSSDGRAMPTGEAMQHMGVQVRVRSSHYTIGLAKAEEIRSALQNVIRRTVAVDSAVYLVQCYARIGDVLYLGVDTPETKRDLFTVNAIVSLRQLS